MARSKRFFYANTKLDRIEKKLEELGFSREDRMVDREGETELNIFYDKKLMEYFYCDDWNLIRMSKIVREKYNDEVPKSTINAIFGYECKDEI